MKAVDHDKWLFKKLQNAKFAAEFLNAAREDKDPKIYLTALGKVLEARGGVKKVTKKTK